MSKANRYRNSPVTPKDQQSLDKFFASPDLVKKRKKPSMDSPQQDTPPTKKQEMDPNENAGQSSANLDQNTYKHIDTKLTDMEKRLETALTASLSESITKNVTAGLKDIIDSSLKEALDTMSKNVDKAIEENPTVVQHGEQIDSLETENMMLKSKVRKMEGNQKEMTKKLNEIERKSLQNNLIFKGIQEDEWEKENISRTKIQKELAKITPGTSETTKLKAARKMQIRCCKRLGRYNKDRARPLSVEFVSKEDVNFIMSNKSNLRKGVYVDREYPIEIEKKRKLLRPILTAAKKQNKFRKKCKMENDLLVIKGKKYGVNKGQGVKNINKLPKSLHPTKISSRSNEEVYGFFGELNPLSNFHHAPFTYNSFTYHCSEQFIQKQKAEMFKDKAAVKRIEQAPNGLACKLQGSKVVNFKKTQWDKKAKELCKPGIKQKFLENRDALMTLLNVTKNKTIVECTKDAVWGCGMALQDDNCLVKTEWTQQGIMGEILEEIRQEFSHLQPEMLSGMDSTDNSSNPSSSDESSESEDDMDTPDKDDANAEAMAMEVSSPGH